MQLENFLLLASLLAPACGHGLVTSIQGANGVNMPGMGLIDGTPRDCSTKGCGAEMDTPIFKKKNANPLGRTKGGGQISANDAVAQFMGTATANNTATPASTAANVAGAQADNTAADNAAQQQEDTTEGGNTAQAANRRELDARQATLATPNKTAPGTKESSVAAAAGQGAQSGLPTADQNGVITMNFHQVNGDGAGPYTAAIDPSSGGTQEAAFQPATMLTQIPGTNSRDKANKASDFQVQVQMPQGMQCTGTVGGVQNVCVVRMKNSAKAGPFGGSAVFQQQGAAQSGNTTNTAGTTGSTGATTGTTGTTTTAGRRAVPMRFEPRQ